MPPDKIQMTHSRQPGDVASQQDRVEGNPISKPEPSGKHLATLSLAALGVIYGDIGTSPLYAFRECFHGEYGIAATPKNILGVLSLMFWALALIVSVKYLVFLLRADNRGEGGVLALTSQLLQDKPASRLNRALVLIGIFGAALLYGDGAITPAISVLSAVEGVGFAIPSFRPWVVPITVFVLVCLFTLQRHGTQRIGFLFGPITTVWFLVLALLGIRMFIGRPEVLAAINPVHAWSFLSSSGIHGFLVLGAVFLVITGAEALFADMGHFGRRPIRVSWYGLVLPSLLCNYFGQGALLLAHPSQSHHPFYGMPPSWAVLPMIVLATVATIIASQAVITGAFSLTRQAIHLGYLPRLRIIHTSSDEIGQVFIPNINWIMMFATVGLVLGFGGSGHLAAAYGVAVTATMSISSLLFFFIAHRRWKWSLWFLIPLVGAFLIADISFLVANFSKIRNGAWFALAVGMMVTVVMTTWKKGRRLLAEKIQADLPTLEELLEQIRSDPPIRVPGDAVFLVGNPLVAPPALVRNIKLNKVLHEKVIVLTIRTEEVSRIRRNNKVRVHSFGDGFWCVTARYGFFEHPRVLHVLALAREKGLECKTEETVFFIGREQIIPDRKPVMSIWREALFSFLSLNSVNATRHFEIPPERVVEIGSQVEI